MSSKATGNYATMPVARPGVGRYRVSKRRKAARNAIQGSAHEAGAPPSPVRFGLQQPLNQGMLVDQQVNKESVHEKEQGHQFVAPLPDLQAWT